MEKRTAVRRSRPWIRRAIVIGVSGLLAIGVTPAHADRKIGGYIVGGAIEVEYDNAGGYNIFGNPTTPESNAVNGKFQVFERSNSIYWSNATGAQQIGGRIRDKWRDLGWETGVLGYPTTRETNAVNGRFNVFQGGSIYWSSATDAHNVQGLIRDAWKSKNWETGPLGFPTTDETALSKNNGKYNHFQGGSIYWSPNTGAHAVWGAIRDTWAKAGWENSSYGYPTSDEYDYQGGKRQDFQGGSINYNTGPIYYDRAAAVAYAEANWNRNPASYRTYANDCTNFVSQVLRAGKLQDRGSGTSTAAATNPANWYAGIDFSAGSDAPTPYNSNTWSLSFMLKSFLQQTTSNGRPLAEEISIKGTPAQKTVPILPPQMQPGDLLFYDWENDGTIDHASVVVGKYNAVTPDTTTQISSTINMHSNNRQHAFWSLKSGNPNWVNTKVFLVHINDSAI